MKKNLTTEEKIRQAAKKVFMLKGFSGCSSREIAKEAGMNVALLNYYFRSKSQLFKLIFDAAMEEFMQSMIQVFSSDLSLQEKLRIFIAGEYDFLSKHPDMPNFIINEINREKDVALDHRAMLVKFQETGIFEECESAQKRGEMRDVSMIGIILLVLSNSHYPVMAKDLMNNLFDLDERAYRQELQNHKETVTKMLLEFLFPTKQ